MIKLENTVTASPEQWKAAVMGARNPMNSWDNSDSLCVPGIFALGDKDRGLLMKLASAGTDHRKFLRFIPVMVDITAPLYWWKQADTYKVGTTTNSCSTMHKLMAKPFEKADFSFEKLDGVIDDDWVNSRIEEFNEMRDCYINFEQLKANGDFDKPIEKQDIWNALIQMLPSSYNQKRTVAMNYEVLRNMYHARKNHKLDEWHVFCRWVETLPCSELITGVSKDENCG